jgi:ABC-type nitrate/sulfonate/bicarbonate transport system substrate-binding protein
MAFSSPTAPLAASRAVLRIGFLALTDAAPFVVAQELGIFERRQLRVELTREIGWATIREKILYGELDAAHAPAPMLWSTQLGVGCAPCDVLTGLVLNLHGNALTLSQALWDAGVRDAATFRTFARDRRSRTPLTFGVVFHFSSHHLMLRDWIRAAGLDPDRDVRIVVVPPAQMFRNLAAGTIDGYCVGEPWNSFAVRENAGWCPAWSAAQQPGLAEKVLMVTARFAAARASDHAALIAALVEACAWCDEPQHRERLAELLADARYLNLPARVITPALFGKFDCGHGRAESIPDFHVFHRGDANVPTRARATALQDALCAAGLLSPALIADPDLPRRLFREDLYRDALHQHRLHEINPTTDQRGIAR